MLNARISSAQNQFWLFAELIERINKPPLSYVWVGFLTMTFVALYPVSKEKRAI